MEYIDSQIVNFTLSKFTCVDILSKILVICAMYVNVEMYACTEPLVFEVVLTELPRCHCDIL